MTATHYCALTEFRISKGWTLRELSKITGLSPATLCRLERGTFKPTSRTRVMLQDRLNLSPERVEELLAHRRTNMVTEVKDALASGA